MTPPKKIYLYPDVGNRNLVKTWFEQQMTKDCLPYFSEEAVREAQFIILQQVSKTLSSTYGIQINSAHITEDIIRLLKGGKE